MNIYDKRNISMMMDLYELTMANGYFLSESEDTRVAFDVFYRKNPDGGGFSIFAGLEQIVEYLQGMHFEDEDIEYVELDDLDDLENLDDLDDYEYESEES